MSSNPDEPRIGLAFLGRSLLRRWYLVVAPTILLTFGAVVITYFVPPEWEAVGIIALGRHARADAFVVEAGESAVERMKGRAFADSLLHGVHAARGHMHSDAQLFLRSAKYRVTAGGNAIEMRVRGFSADDARAFIHAASSMLAQTHQSIAQPTIDRVTMSLRQIERDLADAKAQLERQSKALSSPPSSGGVEVLGAILVSSLRAEISALRARQDDLNAALSAGRPTTLMGEVIVSDAPVFPRRVLTVVLATALGIAIGVMIASVVDFRFGASTGTA